MKGKIAFVLGAAAGYVLGSRAGRERYEQIKNGAQTLWNTAPVQRGVGLVRDAAQTRVDEFKATATRAGKNALAAFLRDDEGGRGSRAEQGGRGSTSSGGGSATGAEHVATDASEAGPGKRASASTPQAPARGGANGSSKTSRNGSGKSSNGSGKSSNGGGDA